MKFSITKQPNHQFIGMRIIAPQEIIFLPGFMCQLIVEILEKLNVSTKKTILLKILYCNQVHYEDITAYANGALLRCPGLFQGEAIVMLEAKSKSIIFAIMALKPSLDLLLMTFKQLCQKKFSQCIFSYFTQQKFYT